jgi:hypothetical protein
MLQTKEMLHDAKLRVLAYLSNEKSEKRSYFWNLESLVINEDEFKWDKFKSDPEYIPHYSITCFTEDKNKNEKTKEFVDYMLNMKRIAENCTCQKKEDEPKND